ncbi:MAG: hypothetical protein IPL50_18630 [Chitinophagaceae bacterium]|nr:hypothetical protein [Chitinophagaceae bacterium]
MNKQSISTLVIAGILIIVAALSRVFMYPDNFSPIIGMAIFAGAVITNKRLAFAFPLLAMFLSDVLFEVFNIAPGFWGWGQLVGYGILALITVIAFSMKRISVLSVAGYSIGASLLFFLLSNSAFFVFDNPIYNLYPQNFSGYITSLAAGIPFLRTGIVADLVYSGVLFGTYFLVKHYAFSKKVIA